MNAKPSIRSVVGRISALVLIVVAVVGVRAVMNPGMCPMGMGGTSCCLGCEHPAAR